MRKGDMEILAYELFERAIMGADFLITMIQDDGKFIYGFTGPRNKTQIPGYNILRHAGAIWAILVAHEYNPKTEYLEKCKLAIDWMLKERMEPFRETRVIMENGIVKLGANALAILALDKFDEATESLEHFRIINDLANYITEYCVDMWGQITYHKRNTELNVATNDKCDFYPGEAALALITIGEDQYREVVRNIINYHYRLGELNDHIRDHWMMQAIDKGKFETEFIPYADNIAYQLINNPVSNQAGPTACRSEALISYLRISRDIKKINSARKALMKYLEFQKSLQIMKGKCKGGFLWSTTSNVVRIDPPQHNICAFLRYYQIVKDTLG